MATLAFEGDSNSFTNMFLIPNSLEQKQLVFCFLLVILRNMYFLEFLLHATNIKVVIISLSFVCEFERFKVNPSD